MILHTGANQWVKDQIASEMRKHLEVNESGNATYQNFRGAAKAALRGKFTAVNANVKKRRGTQVSNVTLQHRERKRTI